MRAHDHIHAVLVEEVLEAEFEGWGEGSDAADPCEVVEVGTVLTIIAVAAVHGSVRESDDPRPFGAIFRPVRLLKRDGYRLQERL